MFSIAETRWGLTAAIILLRLADALGTRQVRHHALAGERFGAEQTRRVGLVHDVVPVAEPPAGGERIEGQVLQKAPEANTQTKVAALEFAWARSMRGYSCQGQPNIPQLCKLNLPHPVQDSVVSSARTRPALSFSLSR